MSESDLRCTVCDPPRTFKSMEQERRHRLEYHADSLTVAIKARSDLSKTYVVDRVSGVSICPYCGTSLTTKTGCRKYLKNNICLTERNNNEEPPELSLPAVTFPEHQVILSPPELRQQPKTRSFNDAVLYSCGDLHASDGEKRKALGIVESFELKPISVKDALGVEQNALAHTTVISKTSTGPVELNSVVLQKRKVDEHDTYSNCTPAPALGLEHIFSSSPFVARLAIRNYMELSGEICELLNRDWHLSSHLRYASATVLVG